MYFNIKEIDLLIVSKNSSFFGDESPFETGVKTPACKRCRMGHICAGPRPEYIDIYGDKEFAPIN